jgi:dephospho-CoA kinase
MSRCDEVGRLEAVVPNLRPARDTGILKDIQVAWAGINSQRGARLITGDTQDNITAGAELLSKEIQVRIENSLSTNDLSYHIFSGDTSRVVLNRRDRDRDRPSRLDGLSPAKIFHAHFETAWRGAVPLESVLAEQVLTAVGPQPGYDALAEQIRDLRIRYRLDAAAEDAVLRHIAFLHAAPVIFITGLPGAGKSLIRRRLADKLATMRFHVDQQSDYVYAFCDFLRHMIRLDEGQAGFSPDAGGAFRVDNECYLEPALHSLAKRVWANASRTPITLVEFARSDMLAALKVFGEEVLSRAQVIYVQASAPLRAARLQARAQPPRTQISSTAIKVLVSDNHKLPSVAANSLYVADNFARLAKERTLEGRIHQLENDHEDLAFVKLDEKLDTFIENVVRPYKVLASQARSPDWARLGRGSGRTRQPAIT